MHEKVPSIVAALGTNKFLAGDSVTYVDFTLFELCDLMDFISEGDLFKTYETLKQYSDRVKALPRLA